MQNGSFELLVAELSLIKIFLSKMRQSVAKRSFAISVQLTLDEVINELI